MGGTYLMIKNNMFAGCSQAVFRNVSHEAKIEDNTAWECPILTEGMDDVSDGFSMIVPRSMGRLGETRPLRSGVETAKKMRWISPTNLED